MLINWLKIVGKFVVKGIVIIVKYMCVKVFFLFFFVNIVVNMCLIVDYIILKICWFFKDVRLFESEYL